MSLARLAIRIATVAALRGRTLAGDGVRDSEIAAFDGYGEDESRPFVAVYTDDSQVEPNQGTRSLLGAGGTLSIVIEIGVTARMKVDKKWDTVIPQTDAGMELTLDYIEREVRTALSDDESEWAEIWRSLFHNIIKVRSVRGASDEKKLRFAGRQIEIAVSPFADPAAGRPPVGIWERFLTAMEADADLADQAKIIRALITGEGDALSWQTMRRELGITAREADAMLLTPVEGAEADVAIQTVAAPAAQPTP